MQIFEGKSLINLTNFCGNFTIQSFHLYLAKITKFLLIKVLLIQNFVSQGIIAETVNTTQHEAGNFMFSFNGFSRIAGFGENKQN